MAALQRAGSHDLELGDTIQENVARDQRRRRRLRAATALGLALLAGALVQFGRYTFGDLPRFRRVAVNDLPNDPVEANVSSKGRPTPPKHPRTSPLGTPMVVEPDEGHQWLALNNIEGGGPVTWDPCRPIHVVINKQREPHGYAPFIHQALDKLSRVTGLHFIIDGTTAEFPKMDRPMVLDRYGDRWAPVLIAWTDRRTVPELGGNLGVASPKQFHGPDGTSSWVTGSIALNGPELAKTGPNETKLVILHELGHLLGLDHVLATNAIMYSNEDGQSDATRFNAGDLAGLVALGSGACHPDR